MLCCHNIFSVAYAVRELCAARTPIEASGAGSSALWSALLDTRVSGLEPSTQDRSDWAASFRGPIATRRRQILQIRSNLSIDSPLAVVRRREPNKPRLL